MIPTNYSKVITSLAMICQQFLKHPEHYVQSLLSYRHSNTLQNPDYWYSHFLRIFSTTINHRDESLRDHSVQLIITICLLKLLGTTAIRKNGFASEDILNSLTSWMESLETVSTSLPKRNTPSLEGFLQLLSSESIQLEDSLVFEYWKALPPKTSEKIPLVFIRLAKELVLQLSQQTTNIIPITNTVIAPQVPADRNNGRKRPVLKKKKSSSSTTTSTARNTVEGKNTGPLANTWFETQLLFKSIPKSSLDWDHVLQVPMH